MKGTPIHRPRPKRVSVSESDVIRPSGNKPTCEDQSLIRPLGANFRRPVASRCHSLGVWLQFDANASDSRRSFWPEEHTPSRGGFVLPR
jgi:hypothetical protein